MEDRVAVLRTELARPRGYNSSGFVKRNAILFPQSPYRRISAFEIKLNQIAGSTVFLAL
jgi:hypothetical protein